MCVCIYHVIVGVLISIVHSDADSRGEGEVDRQCQREAQHLVPLRETGTL